MWKGEGWQHIRRAASSGLSFTSMGRDNDKQACQAVSAVLFALKARHGRYVWLAPNVGGLVVGHGSGGYSDGWGLILISSRSRSSSRKGMRNLLCATSNAQAVRPRYSL